MVWRAHLGLFDLAVTVQGLLFGLGSALRRCVVVWAFALYNVVLDADDQLAIMSSVSFRSGLVVSLATRLFPVLSRDAARISDAQRARGVELDRGRRRDRVAARLPLLGALLTQSLERATDVAESMEARGYGRRGRRAWKRGRRWHAADTTKQASSWNGSPQFTGTAISISNSSATNNAMKNAATNCCSAWHPCTGCP